MLDLGEHVRELERDRLKFCDGPSERVPLLREFQGFLVCAGGETDRKRRDRYAPAVQDRKELVKSLAPLAEQVFLRNRGVDKRQLACVRRTPAHLPVLLRAREAGRFLR